ncbi:MAG TPA: DUF3450 domain-containing protein [Myxococcota bacterium]|nr:DUF3450 domain-containing protein [Myxococcota bacterium]
MKREILKIAVALAGTLPAWLVAQVFAAEGERVPLEAVVDAQLASDRASADSQHRVEALDDETQALLQRYKQLTAETKSKNTYADQLEVQVASQREQIASTNEQLVEIERTSREIVPLMESMLDRIERFIALDIPFLAEERTKRIENLKQVMQRADVTISEKYRRIVEAYQIEMDYGRTLEAYEGKLTSGPEPRIVQFLRIGRVALLYQTLDGSETGYWDAQSRSWVVDDHYRAAVKDGIAVALKQGAPELLIAPVAAPQEAES